MDDERNLDGIKNYNYANFDENHGFEKWVCDNPGLFKQTKFELIQDFVKMVHDEFLKKSPHFEGD